MNTATDKTNVPEKEASLTAKREVKRSYQKPIVIKLGTLASFIQNVLPGTASDGLGDGFDPNPFS